MRIKKALQADQELISHFIAALGTGLTIAAHSRTAKPGFFVNGGRFIQEFIQPIYFKKEAVLMEALEDCGFPPDQGPVGHLRNGQAKSTEISSMLTNAARLWNDGDEAGRGDVVWATSEYTGVMRKHFDHLKNLIYPLIEQSISPEDEQELAAKVNHLDLGAPAYVLREKYQKIIEAMEEEASDWR